MGIHDETIRSILEEKEKEIALFDLAFPPQTLELWHLNTVQFEKDTFVPKNESESRLDSKYSEPQCQL
jgi:hypothetical protein